MDQTNKLFFDAAALGDLACVSSAVAKGADVNVQNGDGRSALMRSAKRGHEDVVRFIIDHDGEVNMRDANEKTAIMGPAKKGHLGIVKLLVDAGADVNAAD